MLQFQTKVNMKLPKLLSVKIDSHQHFWKIERGDYSWLTPELGVLHRDYLPAELRQKLTDVDIQKTILVQAAASNEETNFLLSLAEQHSFIAGVVGWVDMCQPDCIERLEKLSKNKLFKGIRPMLQDLDDVDWILNPNFDVVFETLISKNLTFDALVNEKHLANIKTIAGRYPGLKIVIDHFAKPDFTKPDNPLWLSRMGQFTECKNVYVKLSGLVTETGKELVSEVNFQEYIDDIIEMFGSDRVMWGSDWPVLNLKSDYQSWIKLTDELLEQYSSKIKNKIWAENAIRFYEIGTT